MAKCNDTEMLVHASCQKEQAEDGPKKGQANRARSARAKGRGDLELGHLENEQLQTPAPPTLVTSCSKTPRGSNRDEWAQESRIEGTMTTGIVARLLLFLLPALGRRGRLGCAAHAGAGGATLRPTPLLLPGNVLQLKPRLLHHALIEAVPRVGGIHGGGTGAGLLVL